MDYAGNKSDTAEISNPHYTIPVQSPASASEPVESTESAAPREPNPFTPAGTAAAMDNAAAGDGKEFFTITTPDDIVFYLIIDRQRGSDNVYFLNTVKVEDLMALAEKSSGTSQSAVPAPAQTSQPDPEPIPDPEPPVPAKGGSSGTILLVLLPVLGVGAAGYYFRIVKPKQDADDDDDNEYYDDSDYEDELDYNENDYSFDESEYTQQDEE